MDGEDTSQTDYWSIHGSILDFRSMLFSDAALAETLPAMPDAGVLAKPPVFRFERGIPPEGSADRERFPHPNGFKSYERDEDATESVSLVISAGGSCPSDAVGRWLSGWLQFG